MRKVYIYCLIDPTNNNVRYVGKSVNPEKRYDNKKEFRCWSSKISSIISGKRKSHKKYKFLAV